MATYAINEQFHGIEVSFDSKPAKAVLDALKSAGFRWHNARRLWYAKQTESRLTLVRSITDTTTPTAPAKTAKTAPTAPKAKTNKYGVKVGDVFYTSWGYDQTNIDFFQVIALCGESSVRVRQVDPPRIEDRPYSHGMASDRTYKFTGELLPASALETIISAVKEVFPCA